MSNPAIDTAACVFCEIVTGKAPANLLGDYGSFLVFTPLNPVTPGHALVVPKVHVPDATTDPGVTAGTMATAATWARRWASVNLITSVGAAATQTIQHLHIHVVPRVAGDGLALPWSATRATETRKEPT